MTIERKLNGETATLVVAGRLDTQTAPDLEKELDEILNGLKKAGELGMIPTSVGIDTWGVDYALLDENDQAIGGTYCYRDSRTEATIPEVHSIIPFVNYFCGRFTFLAIPLSTFPRQPFLAKCALIQYNIVRYSYKCPLLKRSLLWCESNDGACWR